jgi:hypothetical protein
VSLCTLLFTAVLTTNRLLCASTAPGHAPRAAHGGDVDERGDGVVREQVLHQLIRQPGNIADRTFEIEFLDAGVETYAFTFG